jgi:hypothetical protein
VAAHGLEASEQVLVGFYDAGSAGGEGLGGRAIAAALADTCGIRTRQLEELSAESLRGVQVLVLPAVRKWGGGMDSFRARQILQEYVKGGGGLLLMYENVGLRGVFEETVFPSVAKGVRVSSNRLVRPVPGYKLTSGLEQFTIGYREQIELRRGPDGVVVLTEVLQNHAS